MSLRCTNLMTLTSDVSAKLRVVSLRCLTVSVTVTVTSVFGVLRCQLPNATAKTPVFLHSLNSSQYESKEPTHVLSVGLFITTHVLSVGLFIKTHALSVGSLPPPPNTILQQTHTPAARF